MSETMETFSKVPTEVAGAAGVDPSSILTKLTGILDNLARRLTVVHNIPRILAPGKFSFNLYYPRWATQARAYILNFP